MNLIRFHEAACYLTTKEDEVSLIGTGSCLAGRKYVVIAPGCGFCQALAFQGFAPCDQLATMLMWFCRDDKDARIVEDTKGL